MTQQICKLAGCATRALDKSVCAVVQVAALEQYAKITKLIKVHTCFDVNEFFGLIALLAVLCWVGDLIKEIIHFVTKTVPRFFKNLLCGKISLCVLKCDKSESESKSKSDSKSDSKSECTSKSDKPVCH